MNMITLRASDSHRATAVSNIFIDNYMPKANGDFVKVYLYLLRILTTSPSVFSLEIIADILGCNEKDVLRAIKYWEQEKLLTLTYDSQQNITGIFLENIIAEIPSELPSKTEASLQPTQSNTISKKPVKKSLSLDRMKELKKQDKIAQLIYITEQYLGKTLSATELQTLLFFYDELKMSPELIEYLIEYCISRNHKSMRYIETVALAWAKDCITTVEQAKSSVGRFSKEYFAILKFMGISNRNPIDSEIGYMNTWLQDYCFDMEIIQEACNRTILQTRQGSFPYADKILVEWKQNNVRNLSDVLKLDAEYKKKKLTKAVQNTSAPKSTTENTSSNSSNRFNNFHQREYDFEEYEKMLLNQ